jgi:tmRNA-binding protein|tara:strand:+ start:232 stop:399 length:168 start_codon:yes stop_codon:yes gene_type:complete
MRFFHEFKTAFLTVHLVPLSFFVAKRTCIMTMGISEAKQKDKEKRTKEEKPDKTY